jgi:RNA polymerase sigma-70 factor (ECF subfamily)
MASRTDDEPTDYQLMVDFVDAQPAEADAILQMLIDRYNQHVFLHVLSMCRSWHDAEEIVQETWTKVWRSRSQFRLKPDSQFRPWLFRIAHNTTLDKFRTGVREGVKENIEEKTFADPAPNPEDDLLKKEKQDLIRKALGRLQPNDRDIVMLRLDGLTYEAIGEISGRLKSTVKTRYLRALRKMVKMLS